MTERLVSSEMWFGNVYLYEYDEVWNDGLLSITTAHDDLDKYKQTDCPPVPVKR
jgi:hypothetical protein